MDFNELLAQARPVTRTVRLCLRGDLIAAREDAERELLAARVEDERTNEPNTALAIAQRILDLEAEQDAASHEFKIQALGRSQWVKLAEAHPPTAEDKANDLDYCATFPPAAIAACCADPEMTPAQVEQLLEVISTRQFLNLWNTVLSVNIGADDLPKSAAATAVLHSSALRSTTADHAASPGDSL